MIPIRDNVPRVHPPVAVIAVIVLNALVFFYTKTLSMRTFYVFVHLFGVVPLRFMEPELAIQAGYPHSYLPVLSYMFLHSGWLHVIMNMWALWIFGDNIEDVTGHVRFVLFYVLCGLVAIVVQIFIEPGFNAPVIGASGAVAGIMGAYFVLYPHGRVLTLVPVLIFPLFFQFPAVLFLALWLLLQVFSGLMGAAGMAQPVAWWAHIGGFVAGMALIHVFRKKDRCYYCYNPDTRDYDKTE